MEKNFQRAKADAPQREKQVSRKLDLAGVALTAISLASGLLIYALLDDARLSVLLVFPCLAFFTGITHITKIEAR